MEDKKKSKFLYVVFLGFQLGFLIVVPLVGFLLLGIFLDKKIKSSPLFLIIFMISSFIFVFFEIRHYLLPILEKRNK